MQGSFSLGGCDQNGNISADLVSARQYAKLKSAETMWDLL